MFRKLGCFVLLAVILAGAAAAGNFIYGWTASGPSEAPISLVVTQGSSLAGVAEELEKRGAIKSASGFLNRAKLLGSGDPIKAGEFRIPAGASNSQILATLQGSNVIRHMVTIPEGMPSILVYETLMNEPLLKGGIEVPREGSVLPETYSFQRGETRQAVLDRMQKAMTLTLARLWAQRSPDTIVGTPEQAVILAGIVEKETSKPSERTTVAAVYGNRIRNGMMLQADPTIIYPITKGKPLGRRIKQSEISAINDYNTYAMTGLPKYPITNPGAASIKAVLHPDETEALYFVADGSGGHVFSNSLEEHNANVRKWYAIRRQRGEM